MRHIGRAVTNARPALLLWREAEPPWQKEITATPEAGSTVLKVGTPFGPKVVQGTGVPSTLPSA